MHSNSYYIRVKRSRQCRADTPVFAVAVVVPVTLPNPTRVNRPGDVGERRNVLRLQRTRNLARIVIDSVAIHTTDPKADVRPYGLRWRQHNGRRSELRRRVIVVGAQDRVAAAGRT